jgi:alpha-beta hydrolase superfamily lysophospholipase
MRADTFTFEADDGKALFVRKWEPEPGVVPVAVVHIAHGMAEHCARYARLAEALTQKGYVVYANDHRGHGKTASAGELGFIGPGGFRRAVMDLHELVLEEKSKHPGLPMFLVGHSMGSFFTQAFMIEHGALLRGAVLSASSGKPNLLASAGRLVARAERARKGARAPSRLLTKLSFDAFNKAFAPTRTGFDWLSRDPSEVDKYVADPLCGFPVSTQLWVDLLDGTADIARPDRQAKVPGDLPVLIFAGARDPVSENTKGLDQLVTAYARAGLRDVTHRYYADGRHEMLNETNRDEVTADLLAWLTAHVS